MQIAIENTVPFSSFMAQAKQVFAEVQTNGPKLIIGEGQPSCVLISHDEYEKIIDELADMAVSRIAEERLAKPRRADEYISQEEIDKEFGFTEENLKGWEEVEIVRREPLDFSKFRSGGRYGVDKDAQEYVKELRSNDRI